MMPADRPSSDRTPEAASAASGYRILPRPDWNRVFARDRGWTGSDNSYSIPLDDPERPTKTLFTFGDSFVGTIDPETGERSPDSVMINNAVGILTGRDPDPEAMRVLVGPPRYGHEASSFVRPPLPEPEAAEITEDEDASSTASPEDVPSTSEHIVSIGDACYYWLQDGCVDDGNLWIFASRVAPNPDGPEGFRFTVEGVDLLGFELHDGELIDDAMPTVLPFPHDIRETAHDVYFGAAVMNDDPTYRYVYGLEQRGGAQLVVARVPKGRLTDMEAWRFWNGEDWTDEVGDVAVIASDVSSECSIQRMAFGPDAGRYTLIYNRHGIQPYVEMRRAARPEGPFDDTTLLYTCPEADDARGIYCYNAKAHPELSPPGSLLISYNVNTRQDAMHMKDGTIYRIRWLELTEEGVFPHPLLQDGAVLQRERSLTLTGQARGEATVTLLWDDEPVETVPVREDGTFSVALPPQSAGGPHTLSFRGERYAFTAEDILVGDVYLAGGQSNMQLAFGESLRAEADRACFDDPKLRVCFVPQRDHLPVDEPAYRRHVGRWSVLKDEALTGFSALAAYAGLKLRRDFPDVPVGIVGCYMGATSATCWMSEATFAAHPALKVYEEEFLDRVAYWAGKDWDEANRAFQARAEAWQTRADAYLKDHPDAIERDIVAAVGPGAWPPPEDEHSFMRPHGLYHTMLEPLRGATFRAVWFYQGEADVGHADLYPEALAAMRGDWRQLFGDVPFLQVQLPAYMGDPEAADSGQWGAIREVQRSFSARFADVGHIVALDQGQLGDLHPKRKHMLGLRMAALTEARVLRGSGETSGAVAADAYVRSVVRSGEILRATVRKRPDADLVYAPGRFGDPRDREEATDSGFDLGLPDGTLCPFATDDVTVAEDNGESAVILLTLDDAKLACLDGASHASVTLRYGMRDDAVATVAVVPEASDSLCEELPADPTGALEAFELTIPTEQAEREV